MGEDCPTFLPPHMQFGWKSPSSRPSDAPLDVGKQNGISAAAANSGADYVSRNMNEPMPAYASSVLPSSVLPNLQLGNSNVPHGWFYCLPRFRQGFTPAPNFTAAEEKLPADHVKGFMDKFDPFGESSSPQKQFLVIDQTAGQTTVYSSKFGSPNECLASWHSKFHGANYLNGNYPLGRDLNHLTLPTLADEVDENQGTDTESEMHEDTEEINALLYSDSDGYSIESDDEDDDVTSTGHSPSTMTTHDNQEPFEGPAEEVSSSTGNSKKRKLLDGYNNDMQFTDTANSLKLKKSFADNDDAESRCSSGNGERSDKMGYLSASKKIKKENIRDVLSALRSIIPGGKDRDPVMLLDDAISCLKSLKLKAKELGLNAL